MKKVNDGNCDNDINGCKIVLDDTHNSVLKGQITANEILQAVSNLKNNKAPGYDKLCNECICASVSCVLPWYVNFYYLIFESGIVPDEWLICIIKPIYKNKGDPTILLNYR